MTQALTATPWLAVLDRIRKTSNDDTTCVLASMLYQILSDTEDPRVDRILDHYALKLLGTLT